MLNNSELQILSDFIYRRCGIFIDPKRFQTLKTKIETVMIQYNYNDFRSLFHDLRFDKNKNIMQVLMNSITVNETYFYREKYQFESLVLDVLPKLNSQRPKDEPLRILCAPCSTGEEPYTIALSLLQEGKLLEQRDVELIGLDIDSGVINKAKRGKYPARSVQFIPSQLLKEHFKEIDGEYEISGFLKDAVNFKIVNVMDKNAMKRLGKFDVIFCRNMLIYFDDTSRKDVAMTFYEMLKTSGVLYLGHAESMNRIVSVFKTAKSFDSIYYVKE